MDYTGEEWRLVPSVPGIMASSHGRIQIIPFIGEMPHGGLRHYSTKPTHGVEQKDATARPGSPKRRIIRFGRAALTLRVHRLVCEAFHGPQPSPAHIVLHLDEDPSNNREVNLRWGTRKENQNFPKARAAFRARTGERSPIAIHRRRQKEKEFRK